MKILIGVKVFMTRSLHAKYHWEGTIPSFTFVRCLNMLSILKGNYVQYPKAFTQNNSWKESVIHNKAIEQRKHYHKYIP